MPILTFIKRIWSPYTSSAAVSGHPHDIGDKRLLSERERNARILELLDNPKSTGKTIEELAKLIGQTDERKP
jgi:uncharacterized protein (DUF1778 family)